MTICIDDNTHYAHWVIKMNSEVKKEIEKLIDPNDKDPGKYTLGRYYNWYLDKIREKGECYETLEITNDGDDYTLWFWGYLADGDVDINDHPESLKIFLKNSMISAPGTSITYSFYK